MPRIYESAELRIEIESALLRGAFKNQTALGMGEADDAPDARVDLFAVSAERRIKSLYDIELYHRIGEQIVSTTPLARIAPVYSVCAQSLLFVALIPSSPIKFCAADGGETLREHLLPAVRVTKD